ncbi:Tetratricopeptide repeat domain protein (fragment) [Planktothrix serta PCC 8927]|uniref:Tetratricopeptide repeat domain protein n=1 Tax=Planktothrix serta PCC 8927 TaxID=671068 RepID=A0A7Z9BKD0_9CYAN
MNDAYLQLLLEILIAIAKNKKNPKAVYPLLLENSDKLDQTFILTLQEWVTEELQDADPDKSNLISSLLYLFNLIISEFPLGNRALNIEIAINCLKLALTVWTRESNTENWAAIQNGLGVNYWSRIQGEKAENLETAIAYYTQALSVLTPNTFPQDWARTQMNLGNAYSDRIQGEKAQNLEKAIACYKDALSVRTRKDFPQDWAITQMNLGAAYESRIQGETAQNLETAITCYKDALSVLTPNAFPQDWARTQMNLGNAYRGRIQGETAQNLEKAIAYYTEALSVYTPNAFPQDWARTQMNLGAAYWRRSRIQGEKAENLENAIACYTQALSVYTRNAFPQDWARTQMNLGTAYSDRTQGEKAENLETAIACYKDALSVRTRKAFPQNHAKTAFNLGRVYQDSQQWQLAYETFADAINTVETLRSQIVSGEEAKQKLAEEWNELYRRMVEVCIELKHYKKAIEYVERSKAQNLVEVLAIRDLYPKGKIPDDKRRELERLRQEIDYEDRRQAAASQRDDTLIDELRKRYDQLYPFKPIQYKEIQGLIDDHTAILQWYIFGDCFRAFIITRHRSQPLIYTFTTTDLEQLQNWAVEYFKAYYASEQAQTKSEQEALQEQWQNSLPSRLQDLAKILQIDQILGKFSELPKSINQLILIPHRYLHLFPLHTLPVSTETWLKFHPQGNPIPSHPTVLDCFSQGVRYTPSNQLLKQVQEQNCTEFDRLFAVQTPNPNLKDLDLGSVNAIKQQFLQSDILKNDRAKKSDILHIDATTKNGSINEKLRNSHCAFFFCHGKFDPNNPLDSGLELADEVVLTLDDIIRYFELKNCRLVTLSACETGLTDFSKNSDEYIGLPSGFILAGATNIVSSLWSVNAIATAILMLKFYQELENLGNIGLALKTAQCWLRDTTVQGFQTWLPTTPLRDAEKAQLKRHFQEQEIEKAATFQPFESPCYWAAFCAIGKGV